MIRSFLISCFLICVVTQSSAQEARRVQEAESNQFHTKLDSQGRVDLQNGLVRARYAQSELKTYFDPTQFLREESSAFGWSEEADELQLLLDRKRANSRHISYKQVFAGLEVDGALVRINMDSRDRVSLVLSSYQPVNAEERSFSTVPVVGAQRARDRAMEELAPGGGLSSEPILVITEPDNPKLAWRVLVWPEIDPAEYWVIVDARSGEILSAQDRSFSSSHEYEEPETGTGEDPNNQAKRVDGVGLVYDTDPLFTAGVSYGNPYKDNGDSANPELNAERFQVTLLDIRERNDGMFVLKGPYADVVGVSSGGSSIYDPPVEASSDGFQYDRDQDGFEAVMSYYHIDKSQRYIQSLGILDVQNEGVRVNPQGLTADDSRYIPTQNLILLGTGGVDDAEDAAVIWHEYGHAVLESGAPGLLRTTEGGSLHEGFADYWAASYKRGRIDAGLTIRTDWRTVFPWDSGDGDLWTGRQLNHNGIYPQDVCSASGGGGCSKHNDGRMWATTLMEVYPELGRELTDHLVLLSHYYLSSPVTFADAAQAIIQADSDYYNGNNASTLIEIFSARGLVSAGSFGPVIVHEPLGNTEDKGVAIAFSTVVEGLSSDIALVELTYFSNSVVSTQVALSAVGDDVYEGELVLPATLDTVSYYIRAVDALGNESFAPQNAPSELYSFLVGDDFTAPQINHEPSESLAYIEWPFILHGSSTDNIGIASVTAHFLLFDEGGNETHSGSFEVSADEGSFAAAFPVELGDLQDGSRLEYYLVAVDNSARENTSRLPSEGVFESSIEAGIQLRNYTFGIIPGSIDLDGQWEVGTPEYGVHATPSATSVLGTAPDAAYSDLAGLSSFTLPAINLNSISPSYLKIWHYYDTEHDGSADPSSSAATIHDGGVVRYRSASTPEWAELLPVGGYSGVLSSGGQNPLQGSGAFGGFSYGWRFNDFILPQEDGLEIRFDFATNAGNAEISERFAGWYIDSIEITTEPEVDVQSPSVLEEPASSVVLSIDTPLARVALDVDDNTGVVDVFLDWSFETRTGTTNGTMRLTQDTEELESFVGFLDFVLAPEPGENISYVIRVLDYIGNETQAPENGSYSVEYRLFGTEDALASLWVTGGWQRADDGWHLSAAHADQFSGLILDTREMEENADQLMLVVLHDYDMRSGLAGLLQYSSNQGESWNELEPEGGYPGLASLDSGSAIDGSPAFIGVSSGTIESRFDLSHVTGEQVQIRFLAESTAQANSSTHWTVESVEFDTQTNDLAFSSKASFDLLPNYPNPFSQRSRITVSVEESASSSLRIYDAMGREVAVLLDRTLEPGTHSFTFDGFGLAAGVYVARFRSGSREKVRTMIMTGQ